MSEKVACPACQGMGWQKQWPGSGREPPPDCRACGGTGEMTQDDADSYFDRQRG